MTTLKKQTECMHARLTTIASNEQNLVEALSDALARADQRLLDDVRSVTIEHESRRAVILSELQTLASRIGAFAATTEPTTIAYDEQFELDEQLELDDPLDLPFLEPAEAPVQPRVNEVRRDHVGAVGDGARSNRGGDWRKATKNICDDWGIPVNGSDTVS